MKPLLWYEFRDVLNNVNHNNTASITQFSNKYPEACNYAQEIRFTLIKRSSRSFNRSALALRCSYYCLDRVV